MPYAALAALSGVAFGALAVAVRGGLRQGVQPALVLGGVALAAERTRPTHFRARVVALAIVCAGLFAGRDNLLRLAARDNRPPPLLAATATLTGALAFLAVCGLLSSGAHLGELPRAVRAFAPAGMALALGYDALLSAYDRGPVSVVAPLNATGSFWAVILTVLLFGRSEMVGRRANAAAILIVAGGALIGGEPGSRGTEGDTPSPHSVVGFAGAALGVPGRGSARTAVHRGAE